MSLDARDRQELAYIAGSLARSDPALAEQFERFNQAAGDRVHRERRGQRAVLTKLAVLVLSLAAAIWFLAAVAGSGRVVSKFCAAAITACPPAHYACREPGGIHPVVGSAACVHPSAPNTP